LAFEPAVNLGIISFAEPPPRHQKQKSGHDCGKQGQRLSEMCSTDLVHRLLTLMSLPSSFVPASLMLNLLGNRDRSKRPDVGHVGRSPDLIARVKT